VAGGEIVEVTFPEGTFEAAGTYYPYAYVYVEGDENPANDTMYGEPVYIIPYAEDFEASNARYTREPEYIGWEWGEPTYGPPGAYSGDNCWGTILYDEYHNNADWKLHSRTYFVDTGEVWLFFYHWYDIESHWDGGNVKISVNGGPWQIIYPEDGYPEPEVSSSNAGIPGEPAYSGYSGGWQLAVFDLTPYVSPGDRFKIRWHFGSDASVTYPGWYIDNVAFIGLIEEEPWDVSIPTPEIEGVEAATEGTAISMGVEVYNSSMSPEPTDLRVVMRVVYEPTGAIVFNDFRDVTIDPGESQTVYFDEWVPIQPGNYIGNVVLQTGMDPNLSNNMLVDTFTVAGKLGVAELPATYDLTVKTLNIGAVRFNYALPKASNIELTIYDAMGRIVHEVSRMEDAGYGDITVQLDSGIYFYRYVGGEYTRSGKIIICK